MIQVDGCEISQDVNSEIRGVVDDLLKDAGAYGKFPTPTADLVAAAGLRVDHSFFTEEDILRKMEAAPAGKVRRTRDALLGLVDVPGRTIYLKPGSPHDGRLPPLALHETAHAYLPWQKDIYLFIQEGGPGLLREMQDQFEREANQFAWDLVFQLDYFRHDAEAGEFSLRTPANLSHRYGTTPYAAIRRFVETSRRTCALLIWSRMGGFDGAILPPSRTVQSPGFSRRFGGLDLSNTFNPFLLSELMTVTEYGKRNLVDLIAQDQCQVRCETQSLKLDGHIFVLIYPENELLAVPYVRGK